MRNKDYYEKWGFNFIDAKQNHQLWVRWGIQKTAAHQYAKLEIYTNVTDKIVINYPIEEYSYSPKRKIVTLGRSVFTKDYIELDIQNELIRLQGTLEFKNKIELKSHFGKKSIMGPFSKLPFVSVYYDIEKLSTGLDGTLIYNNQNIEFTGGKGFVEKIRGSKWPNIWILSKCNHFNRDPHAAIVLGIARMGVAFNHCTGFVLAISANDKRYLLTSYNGAHVVKFYKDKNNIHLIMSYKSLLVELNIMGREDNPLARSNYHGIKDVYESMNGLMEIKISEKGHIIWSDKGKLTSLEIAGNTSKL